MGPHPALLFFVDGTSHRFQAHMSAYEALMERLNRHFNIDTRVVDIHEAADMLDRYKVNVVPMLVYGTLRFVGHPDVDKVFDHIENDLSSGR